MSRDSKNANDKSRSSKRGDSKAQIQINPKVPVFDSMYLCPQIMAEFFEQMENRHLI